MCSSCQPSHSGLHATSIVRFTFVPWPPQPDVSETTASCSECSLNVKCRLECSDCSSCLCIECGGYKERRQKWYEHRNQHQRIKGFIYIASPLDELVPSTSSQCDCLTVRGCISHCSRCERGKTRSIEQLYYTYIRLSSYGHTRDCSLPTGFNPFSFYAGGNPLAQSAAVSVLLKILMP